MVAEFDWGGAVIGSPIFLALILFSIAMLGAAIERLVYYHRRRHDPSPMLQTILERIAGGDAADATHACREVDHPLGVVSRRLLEHDGADGDDEEVILIALSEERLLLEHNLGKLGSIAAISPLVGLLGTVWGIMRAFHDMSASGSAAPAVVAGGVAEALTTTAAGLIIAVPAVLLYNHFTRRANVMLATAENGARRVRSALHHERRAAEATTPPAVADHIQAA